MVIVSDSGDMIVERVRVGVEMASCTAERVVTIVSENGRMVRLEAGFAG
jgi:hypothetical protein